MNQRISLLCLSLGPAITSCGQTVVDSILHDGIYRTYRLYAPPGFAASENPALVFNLHGLGSNAEQQEAYSRMNLVAEGERFVICYVNGVNSSWNLGLGQVDDVGLIGALIDRFVLTHGVDDQRVYSCGMSQGGFFSFRLACELPERIAAIGNVAGGMAPGLAAFCDPPRPVPVIMVNGTADAIVPYTGGVQNIAVDDAMTHWVTHNGCATPAMITPLPDVVATDGCTATRADFGGCAQGTEVDLIAVIGGGHTWPGATIPIGVTCQDLDASWELWWFFERFTLSGAVSVNEVTATFSSIHPVPAERVLTIRLGNGSWARLIVSDALGRTMLDSRVADGAQLDISALPSGRYTASVNRDGRTECHPVIVKH